MNSKSAIFGLLLAILLYDTSAECDKTCWGSTDRYCRDDDVCANIATDFPATPSYKYIFDDEEYNSGSYSRFRVVMISDIQVYYTNCKQQKWLCIFDPSNPGFRADKIKALKNSLKRQSSCVKNRRNKVTKLLIDGGDLTNDATATELQEYNAFLSGLPTIPKALTLGNHDYYLQSGSNALKKTSLGAGRMISYLEKSINSLSKLDTSLGVYLKSADIQVDEISDPNGDMKFLKGSLMYALEVEGYVFIVMHWVAPNKGSSYTDKFGVATNCMTPATCKSDSGKKELYEITDGYDWIKKELIRAEGESKKVVLVPHYALNLPAYLNGGKNSVDLSLANLRTLVKSNVVAILTGHDHDQWGAYGYLNVDSSGSSVSKSNSGDIPVYFAGSASYEKLISIDFNYNKDAVAVESITTRAANKCGVVASDNSNDIITPSPIAYV